MYHFITSSFYFCHLQIKSENGIKTEPKTEPKIEGEVPSSSPSAVAPPTSAGIVTSTTALG